MESRRFRAMGTDIELLVDAKGAALALAAAEAEFHRLEALLSRFREGSELSRLNAAGTLTAGPDLRRVVELALVARERTGGRFDPTVHDALVAAGYDRSFDDMPSEAADVDVHHHRHLHPPAPAAPDVAVDRDEIRLHGVRLDLGGIGKGYAAERAAEVLATAGPCLVNAGGDVATRGGPWPVGVETADGTLTLALEGGSGLATSGRDRRRWRRGDRELHHLIDPRTGAPAETDLLRVTVVGRDAVEAEVSAKSLFLAGSAQAVAEADAAAVPAVLVTDGGHTLLAGGLT
jgi:thiamine biosynthesis lipoprotein